MKSIARKKNYLSLAVVLVLLCAFIAGIGLSAAKAEAAETQQTIRIAHISDMHVMIEEYCNVYSGKYLAETKVTKLLEETPMIAEAVFDDIYDMDENAPMYVFITGDITSNGEYENHVWLSKLYKAFTQKMRSRTDYDFSGFQIFLSPGNHDLYNCRAKSFMPTTEELDACANDAERMTLLENYKPRSVASITSKQFMDLYSDFGYCSCPDRKNGHHLASCGMADGCKLEYFFESDYWYDDVTSRDGAGLEVKIPSEKTLEAFKNSDKDYNVLNPDARFGACSYIAHMNDFDVVTFDANTRGYKYEKWQDEGNTAEFSCGGWHESTGGMISEDQLRWAITSVKEDVADGKPVFALGHTNFLPHFDSEDEVISLFTYDNWEQASYTLADNGIRYVFSGHQHASDITSYVTQNGNVLYDMEACSLVSYGCAWRTMDLKRTISSTGEITEDFESLAHNLNYSPFEYGVYKLTSDATIPAAQDPYNIIPLAHPNGYMTLEKKVTVDKITGEEIGIADYLAAQMYNMASSLEHGLPGEYVGEKIYGLLNDLTEKLSSMTYTQGIVSALVDGLSSVDLCKFSFDGNVYSVGQTPTAGYDIADFTEDLASYLIQYDFSGAEKKGLTLAKAFMIIYGGHLSGAHSNVMDEEIKPLIEMLESGRFVYGVLNLLEESLLPQLEALLDVPIRFDAATPVLTGAGFDLAPNLTSVRPSNLIDALVKTLVDYKIVFAHTKDGYSSLRLLLADINEVLTDVLVTPKEQIKNSVVSTFASALRGVIGNLSIDKKYIDMARGYLGRVTEGETLRSIVDQELVNKYVTDAFCKSLGVYGANILIDMNVDETDDGSEWIEGGDRYTRLPVHNYKHILTVKNEDGTVAFGGHTYQSGVRLAVTPSADNGLLPGLISVSFNNDIYTEKNLCWFTAEQVDIFNKIDGKYAYAVPDSYIRYSLSSDMANAVTVKATGENVDRVLPTIDLGIIFINMNHAHKIYNRFSVNLTGLEKGTVYYYQLGKEGAWTKVFRFATASEGEFSFMAITDIQGSVEDNYIESNGFMTKAMGFFGGAPAFILSGGDNVDNGKNILQYTWLLNDQQEIWANNTFVSAVGNHEKSDHALDSIIALPDSAIITGDTGYYYSYDYNNAHFIVLNTNDLDDENYLSSEQESWLIDDLTADQANEKTNWTIVLLHKGPYTAGSHAFDDDVKVLRKQLPSIFAEFGVDLVLQGHDHTYSVSNFIGEEGETVAPFSNNKTYYKQAGVLYVNLGTMGDKFYDYIYSDQVSLADRNAVSDKLSPYFTADKKLELTETPVFAKITVNNDNLIVKTYTFVGEEIVPVDDFTLSHLDAPKGLSAGAIAGIVVGSVAGAALIAVGIIFIIKKKGGKK